MALGHIHNAQPYEDHEREKNRNRYFGEFMGFVRDRADPTKAGRVRVHVPSLTGAENTADNWLDWCYPKASGLFVPPIDAPVVVTFEQGYIQHGFYEWGWIVGETPEDSQTPNAGKEVNDPTWLDREVFSPGGVGPAFSIDMPKDTAKDNHPVYPFNKVFQSEAGHVFELDDSPGLQRVRFRHPAGTTILIDSDGSVHIRSAGAQWFHSGGDIGFAIGQGGTFKIVYPNGTGLHIGADGFHVTGHAASILGRQIERNPVGIK